MNSLLLLTVFSFFIFLYSLYQTKTKQNPNGLTRFLLPLGIFVWGDGVIFGLFWFLVGLFLLTTQSSHLFAIIYAIFWIVRSAGEALYWFLQQFSKIQRDPPHTVPFSSIFAGESVWFAMQIIWQCVLVISITVLLRLLQLL